MRSPLSSVSAMTDGNDDYRAKAEHCRQMANQVLSPIDQEMWRQLADDWLTLASVQERYGSGRYRAPELQDR
jgi:hypothetical protein